MSRLIDRRGQAQPLPDAAVAQLHGCCHVIRQIKRLCRSYKHGIARCQIHFFLGRIGVQKKAVGSQVVTNVCHLFFIKRFDHGSALLEKLLVDQKHRTTSLLYATNKAQFRPDFKGLL